MYWLNYLDRNAIALAKREYSLPKLTLLSTNCATAAADELAWVSSDAS